MDESDERISFRLDGGGGHLLGPFYPNRDNLQLTPHPHPFCPPPPSHSPVLYPVSSGSTVCTGSPCPPETYGNAGNAARTMHRHTEPCTDDCMPHQTRQTHASTITLSTSLLRNTRLLCYVKCMRKLNIFFVKCTHRLSTREIYCVFVSRHRGEPVVGRGLLAVPKGVLLHRHR